MFNLRTGPQLLDRVEALLPEHRERLFPPTETLSMFWGLHLTGVLSYGRIPSVPSSPDWAETTHNMHHRTHA
jgi:hypothetical protein